MKERNCKDCSCCIEHRHFIYCNCPERKDIKVSKKYNYNEAKKCKFYEEFQ